MYTESVDNPRGEPVDETAISTVRNACNFWRSFRKDCMWRGGKSCYTDIKIFFPRVGEDYWRSIRGVDKEFSYRGRMSVSTSRALRGQVG